MSENALRAALVTGAGSGIGRAIAKRFEQNGWTVFRFDVSLPDGARAVVGDVRSQEEWATLARRIDSDIGRLDVLVNNAGILREAPLGDTTLEMWNEVIAVNLTGAFLGCRAMLPLLRKGNVPAILNLGSVDALRGSLRHSAYAASKGGIVAMTRALALELANDGIRVNAICPGTVDTPMVEHIMANAAKGGPDRVALHP
jgi:3alpha(or 20beta)-hydroxysteroid dehydrogenase